MILKVCGMRDAHNIREVEELAKPQMMGFICWPKSPRYVAYTPFYMPRCIKVGVFVDPDLDFIVKKAEELSLQRIQLHGHESPEFCQRAIMATGLPIIKAISVRERNDILTYRPYEGICDMLLFDTKCKTVGGSGEQFDWEILRNYNGSIPFLLAGGIGPGDEWRVRDFRHPLCLGIDVNSRFETEVGVKNALMLQKFNRKIRPS